MSKIVTAEELKAHSTKTSLYTLIHGKGTFDSFHMKWFDLLILA